MPESPAILLREGSSPLTRPSGTLSPPGRGQNEAAARTVPVPLAPAGRGVRGEGAGRADEEHRREDRGSKRPCFSTVPPGPPFARGGKLAVLGPVSRGIGLVGPMTNYAAPPQLVEGVGYRDLNEMHGFAPLREASQSILHDDRKGRAGEPPSLFKLSRRAARRNRGGRHRLEGPHTRDRPCTSHDSAAGAASRRHNRKKRISQRRSISLRSL